MSACWGYFEHPCFVRRQPFCRNWRKHSNQQVSHSKQGCLGPQCEDIYSSRSATASALPLLPLVTLDRQWARTHSRQAKLRRPLVATSRWNYVATAGINYLFAGMQVLLGDALIPFDCDHPDFQASRQAAHALLQHASTRMVQGDAALDQQHLRKAQRGCRVSYNGEIIDHAHYLTPSQIMPCLPSASAGARVDLLSLVNETELPWIRTPELALKPRQEWPSPPPRARVMVADQHWNDIVKLRTL
eukprot:2905775-Amphidinium_carterae.1